MQEFLKIFNEEYFLVDRTNSENKYTTHTDDLDYQLTEWESVLIKYGNTRVRTQSIWGKKDYILKLINSKLNSGGLVLNNEEKEDLLHLTMQIISENITKIDPAKGNIWILISNYINPIFKTFIDQQSLINTKSSNLPKMRFVIRQLKSQNPERRTIPTEEIAAEMNLDVNVVKNLQNTINRTGKYIGIDQPLNQDSGACASDLIEELSDLNTPEDKMINNDIQDKIILMINSLPEKEKQILKWRIIDGLKYEEIAKKMLISSERVRQILEVIFALLKTNKRMELIEVKMVNETLFKEWCVKNGFNEKEKQEWIKITNEAKKIEDIAIVIEEEQNLNELGYTTGR